MQPSAQDLTNTEESAGGVWEGGRGRPSSRAALTCPYTPLPPQGPIIVVNHGNPPVKNGTPYLSQ